MHRDLRLDNVACTCNRDYFLLDLELCGVLEKPKFGKLESWSEGVLADGIHCTEAFDVIALGKMLQGLQVVISADGLSCLADMCNAESGQPVPPADNVLKHRWLPCTRSCTLKDSA